MQHLLLVLPPLGILDRLPGEPVEQSGRQDRTSVTPSEPLETGVGEQVRQAGHARLPVLIGQSHQGPR
jgi:hypothetical protein